MARIELVTIKKEHLSADEIANGGDKEWYIVAEDNGDRLYITPIHSKLAIKPQELVRRDMVNSRGFVEEDLLNPLTNPGK